MLLTTEPISSIAEVETIVGSPTPADTLTMRCVHETGLPGGPAEVACLASRGEATLLTAVALAIEVVDEEYEEGRIGAGTHQD